MDLLKLTIGYSQSEIDYKIITNFFKIERDETLNLEFKSYDSTKSFENNINNLIETVSAFLNSDGGVILLGAPKTQKDGKRKFCVGELTPMNTSFDIDDVSRRIVANISSPPNTINPIVIADGADSILIIIVKKSDYSPHQVRETGIYYMRVGANNFPAPHYFVESLVKKVRYPELKGKIIFDSVANTSNHIPPALKLFIEIITENHSALQNEEFPHCTIYCNTGKIISSSDPWPLPPISPRIISPKVYPPMELLSSGQRIKKELAIGFYQHELKKINFKLSILLQFGGRYSPMKHSFYQIDLSFFNNLEFKQNTAYRINSEKVIVLKESILWADSDLSSDDLIDWDSGYF